VCFTNHQTLIVAAMGIEVAIAAAQPRLGRDLFLGNGVIFLVCMVLKANGKLPGFENNRPLFVIFIVIGVLSIKAWIWLATKTMKRTEDWTALGRDILMSVGAGYLVFLVLIESGAIYIGESRSSGLALAHLAGFGALAAGRGVLFLHAAGFDDESAVELGLSADLGRFSSCADARPV